MGDKKRRRARFFAAHPTCCYCAVAPVETEDHFPPRASFMRRQWPEGFVFPACHACNAELKGEEQVFSFYVRALDQDDRTYDLPQFAGQIEAMRNNYPDLMPTVDLPAVQIRRILRERGEVPPPGTLLTDIGVTLIPKGIDTVFHKVGGKLAKALHYHATGNFLPSDMRVYVKWFDFNHKDAAKAVEGLSNLLPNLIIGTRSSTDIYDQFSYKWGGSEDGRLFGYIAQFSGAMFIVGVAVAETMDAFGESGGWKRVA
jgi:hypothetical protein